MNTITNDEEFKQALHQLDAKQQRVLAAQFAEHVLPLSNDERLTRALAVAGNAEASSADVDDALQSARAATIDSHTRCGSEGNWTDQAGYFVGRAVVAALSSGEQSRAKSPAWQAAMSSRMARTSILIDDDSDQIVTHSEDQWQYDTLSSFLGS
jgi:hypothetical protein